MAAALALGMLLPAVCGAGQRPADGWRAVAADYREFYTPPELLALAAGVAASGVLAHSGADTGARDHVQEHWRGAVTDRLARPVGLAGDVRVALPLYAAGWVAGRLLPEGRLGRACGPWGERSLRAFAVGAPAVLALEVGIGSSRPENGGDARWRPLRDHQGVSGHAFLGAVTFLSAARLAETRAARWGFAAASVLPALARVNDDRHYPSQAGLGWLIGYLAVAAVDTSGGDFGALSVVPGAVAGRPGLVCTLAF